ncbi:MAG: POTRA domain-containing protein, partial [Candidatus Thiodiazotropha sp.]
MRQLIFILVWAFCPIPLYALDVVIKVDGLETKLKENVLAYLSVERERQRESLNAARLRLLHDKAEAEIQAALRPFGYFKPTVTASMAGDEQGFRLSYHVEPGPPVKLSDVNFQLTGDGADDPQLTKTFPMSVGEVLDQTRYEQSKQRLLAEIIESGYLDARYIQHQLRVDLQHYTASIQLHLDSGKRLRFGDVRMHQDILNPDYLARFVPFNAGDPF